MEKRPPGASIGSAPLPGEEGEVVALGGAGLGGVGSELRGHGVVEEQIALRHGLSEVTLHHAGIA